MRLTSRLHRVCNRNIAVVLAKFLPSFSAGGSNRITVIVPLFWAVVVGECRRCVSTSLFCRFQAPIYGEEDGDVPPPIFLYFFLIMVALHFRFRALSPKILSLPFVPPPPQRPRFSALFAMNHRICMTDECPWITCYMCTALHSWAVGLASAAACSTGSLSPNPSCPFRVTTIGVIKLFSELVLPCKQTMTFHMG